MTTRHRIADWIILATVINRALQLDEKYNINFDNFLDNINKERAAFVLEGEPILQYCRRVCEQYPREAFGARQLEDLFKEFNPDSDYTTQQIAKILNKYELSLRDLYNLKITYDRSAKRKLYAFGMRLHDVQVPQQALSDYLEPDTEESIDEEETPIPDISEARLDILNTLQNTVRDYQESHDDESMPIEELVLNLIESLNYSRTEAVQIISEATRRGILFEPQTDHVRVP